MGLALCLMTMDTYTFQLAIVVDATSVTIYVDGQPRGSGPAAPDFALEMDSYFGYFWDGAMDDARIYQRPLPPPQVQALADL